MTVADKNLRVRQAMPIPGVAVRLTPSDKRPQGSQGPGMFPGLTKADEQEPPTEAPEEPALRPFVSKWGTGPAVDLEEILGAEWPAGKPR